MIGKEGARPPAFVLVTESEAATRQLQESIAEQGELILSDPSSLGRILQIIDSVGAVLAIVHVPADNYSPQLTLITELHAAKSLLPILVFADVLDPDLVLAVMRCGASDLIAKNPSREEIRERLQHLLKRSGPASVLGERSRGKIIALVSARPDADTALLSLHLALAIQDLLPDAKTLLLDLGVPEADSLLYLGLSASYSFVDAVRSTRRFDETLIETAFARHNSGLALLAMPEEAASDDITANDVIVLLNILRSYYGVIIMNLGGLPKSQFLQLTASHADDIYLLCEQTVPSCRSNKRLMEFFHKNHVDRNISLVVDRYLEKQDPVAQEIAGRLGIPLRTTLPPSGLVRLNMKNSGQTLFEFAPKDRYTQAVEQFARSVLSQKFPDKRRSGFSFLKHLLQR